MCSNMCARPVLDIGSWTEPASTCVKKENTGGSGRSQIITVRPLASFLVVMRFSNEARSWLNARDEKQKTVAIKRTLRNFIPPPAAGNPEIRRYLRAREIVKPALNK